MAVEVINTNELYTRISPKDIIYQKDWNMFHKEFLETFLKNISNDFSLNYEQLFHDFYTVLFENKHNDTDILNNGIDNISSTDIHNMKLKELKELCIDNGIPSSGTKAVLIERLTKFKAGENVNKRQKKNTLVKSSQSESNNDDIDDVAVIMYFNNKLERVFNEKDGSKYLVNEKKNWVFKECDDDDIEWVGILKKNKIYETDNIPDEVLQKFSDDNN